MHTYYSPREAAEHLGLSPLTLANWRSRGLGPAFVKLGEDQTDRIIYRHRDLELWHKERASRVGAKARHVAEAKPVAAKSAQPSKRTSYARRVAEGERFEDLPAFSRTARES